jgi:hypothetical protein
MYKLIAVNVLGMLCLQIRGFQLGPMPEPRHLIGKVVDTDGKPVIEARIDHGTRPYACQTDREGNFALDTRASCRGPKDRVQKRTGTYT